MTDEDITEFNDKITEKLGKENAAIIADDMGVLITKHSEAKKREAETAKKLEDLQKMNERLTSANASLIHQISTDHIETTPTPQPSKYEDFNLHDAFNEDGSFKK